MNRRRYPSLSNKELYGSPEERKASEDEARRRIAARTAVRLLKRLRKDFTELKIPKNAELRRVYAGRRTSDRAAP